MRSRTKRKGIAVVAATFAAVGASVSTSSAQQGRAGLPTPNAGESDDPGASELAEQARDVARALGLPVESADIDSFVDAPATEQIRVLRAAGLDVPTPYVLDQATGMYLAGQFLERDDPSAGAELILRSNRFTREVGLRALQELDVSRIHVDPSEVADYRRFDPNATDDRATQELRQQHALTALNSYLWKFEPTFAGLFIEREDGFHAVVQYVGSDATPVARAIPDGVLKTATVRPVQYGLRRLMDIQAQVSPVGSAETDIDIARDQVVVISESSQIGAQYESSTDAFKALEAEGVVRVDRRSIATPSTTLIGGAPARYLGVLSCTWGFTATAGAYGGGFLTAAHCPDGMTWDYTNTVFGSQQQIGETDAQWNAAYPNTTDNMIAIGVAPYFVDITSKQGWSTMIVGQGGICHQGVSTGWTCGAIASKNRSLGYVPGSSRFVELEGPNIDSQVGDSGGPVASGPTALGIMSAGAGPNPYGRNNAIFGAIDYAEASLSVTVQTK